MKKSQEQSSYLQDEQRAPTQTIQKQQNQFKALFLKNTILQSKQKCTNVCQILTPVICLVMTYLMRIVAEQNLPIARPYDDNAYPYKFNDFVTFDKQNRFSRNPLQYYLYECSAECDQTFLGKNYNQTRQGMLGDIWQTNKNIPDYRPDPYYSNDTIIQDSPFFKQANSSVNEDLFIRLETMSTKSFDLIKKGHGLDYLPDGAMKFNVLNGQHMDVQLKVDDCRDLDYHRLNAITRQRQYRRIQADNVTFATNEYVPPYGMLHIMHMTTASYIQQLKDVIVVSAGYIFMPSVEQNTFVDSLINSISALIFPLGLSLLFPVFLYSIVLEKEERLVQMMKMNGLKIRYYWLTFLIFNLILCIITNLVFFFSGSFIFVSPFFKKTSTILLLIVSFGWCLSQIGMAAFFQTFLNKSRSANIIGYLVSIWTTMIGATLNLGVYQYPSQFPIALQMFPPFAFVRLFYLMMMECSNGDCFFDISNISQQMKNCIVFLYLGFLIFFLLGAYLFEVIPQQFGVSRSPLFPFQSISSIFKKKAHISINTCQDQQLKDYISEHEQDNLSKQQRQKVIGFSRQENQQEIKSENPLIINNMRKLYKKQGVVGWYAAVRSFNLAIEKNQTFGLLGPNGAGKTTLISMITGMYQPNHGNAWIGGYDIKNNIQKAQLEMGVCPQFDLVWPQMSVSQHLYFYARLKGIPQNKIKKQVQSSIKQVKLQNFSNFNANQLSGGMKRRLSVAISLVGDPKIVFLDQPSTGLDPQNRRQLWSVLAQCQTKRALFITTHMMQQADTLCNRIGIITNGALRTIGSPIKLKKLYGQGYDVVINTVREERQLISQQSLNLGIQEEHWFNEEEKIKDSIGSFIQQEKSKNFRLNQTNYKIAQFMKKQFPGTYLSKHFNGYLIFKIPTTYKISTLFETMNQVEKQLGFSDIAISNSSLEDVFMKVVSKYDVEQKSTYSLNDQKQIEQNEQPGNESSNIIHEFHSPNLNRSGTSLSKNTLPNEDSSIRKGNGNIDHVQSVSSRQRDSVISEIEGQHKKSEKKQQLKKNDDSNSSDEAQPSNIKKSQVSQSDSYF